jgi:hypothetical protein
MKRVRCLNDLNDVGILLLRRLLTGSLAEWAGSGKPGAKDLKLMDAETRLRDPLYLG